MTALNGGAAVVHALEAAGADIVFGIPGTHNLEIYRHLAGSSLRHVTPRHEQGAGYAADGYARVSGRPAVCLTTSGPGLTNIVTAMATAFADSVPMLVVAPGAPRGTVGADLGLLHELRDQRSVMGSVVDVAVRVESPDEAYTAIVEAFARFATARPRPAYVEVPVDVLEAPWFEPPADAAPASVDVLPPNRSSILAAAAALSAAERPAVVVGGGGRSAGALVQQVVERLGAILVTTVNGKGAVDEQHPLTLGAALRLPAALELVSQADAVLLVGTEVGDSDLWEQPLELAGLVIRVDIDEQQLDKNVPAEIRIKGRAADVLRALLGALDVADPLDRGAEVGKVREVLARQCAADGAVWRELQEAVRAGVTGDVIIGGDSAMVSYLGTVHHWPMGPQDRFLYPTGYATLGYGLPAAIGGKLAAPDTATVVLVGDGGFMFSVQELITAAELGLALPVIVVNNGGYRAIRDQMVERGVPTMGVDLTNPDLVALGHAFGIDALRVPGFADLGAAVEQALRAQGPTLIEVLVP